MLLVERVVSEVESWRSHAAGHWRRIGPALLLGLLIRLLVMPFFTHGDMLNSYWRSHLWVDLGRFEKVGFQIPVQYMHAGFLWLLSPALPPSEAIWPAELDDRSLDELSSPDDWKQLISNPKIYRTLFLLKLPYLLFDIGCLVILFCLMRNTQHAQLVITFWWLNPIIIFGSYIFSRHDIIVQFFVLLSLLQFARNKIIWALVWLGVAIAFRFYPILLLPFYILPVRSFKQLLRWGLLGVLPFILVELYSRVFLGHYGVGGLVALPHNNYLLSARLLLAGWDNLYIFPLSYFLLVLHRIYGQERSWQSLIRYALLGLLLLFAFAATGQSPHYWTWLIPFLALGTAADHRLIPLHYVQCGLLLLYSFVGGRSTAGFLLGSVSPDFFWALPGPAEIIGQYMPIETFISLARTALAAVTLWMAYLVFRTITERQAQ